jgi:dTDP-4-dehydrorhamnose 3,5-epimerase
MELTISKIAEVKIIQPRLFEDSRGFFMETYQETSYSQFGISAKFVQDNHSGSHKGVLRGLHYQIQHPQGKLVRVVAGEVFDVAVDLRKYSPTFSQWVGSTLSSKNNYQIWVPPGFAHGYLVLSDWAEVIYKTTDFYFPNFERTLLWCDTQIKVDWPIEPGCKPIVSEKDSSGKIFEMADIYEKEDML